MDVVIRKATLDDIEAIADIKIEGWRTAYKEIVDKKYLKSLDKNREIEKRKNNIRNGASVVVAELNNQIVGYCFYRNDNENIPKYPEADCEVTALYVRSSLKRNGIGSKLFEYVLNELKNQEKSLMILGCLKENYPSRNFYEKMGGILLSDDKMEFGNKEYDLVIYKFFLKK